MKSLCNSIYELTSGLSISNESAKVAYHKQIVVLIFLIRQVELAHGTVIGLESDDVLLNPLQAERCRVP